MSALRVVVARGSPLAAAASHVFKQVSAQVESGDEYKVTTAAGETFSGLQAAAVAAIAAGHDGARGLFGADDRESAHVNQWIGMASDVASGAVPLADAEMLLPMGAKHVAGTAAPSAADALLFAAVAPEALAAPKTFPKLNKWLSGIEKAELIAPIASACKPAAASAAAAAEGGDASSGKAKDGAAAAAGGKPQWAKPNEEEIAARRAQKEKEKAEKERLKAAGGAAPAAAPAAKKEKAAAAAPEEAAAAEAAPLDPAELDLRVGLITSVDKHPKADRLFVETIDLGEASGPRTIVSGLVAYYKPEDILNRKVVVVANMKAKPLMGVPSHGMVLCASVDVVNPDDQTKSTTLELLPVPEGAAPGARVSIGGRLAPELPGITKKMTELLAPLRTDESGRALWGDQPLAVDAAPLVSNIKLALVK